VASRVWPALRKSYAGVRKLYDDLLPAAEAAQEWTGTVYARKTLGRDVSVTAWTLAEHFLLGWADWTGFRQRFLAYFGHHDEVLSGAWLTLEHRCRLLAGWLLRDRTLGKLIAENWASSELGRLIGMADESARATCHVLLANHQHLAVFGALLAGSAAPFDKLKQPPPWDPVWRRTASLVREINQSLARDWQELPRDHRQSALWHLRHYRRATLLASWLVHDSRSVANRDHSALVHVLREDTPVAPDISELVRHRAIDDRYRDIVRRVLERIQAAVADFGYDNFVEDVSADNFFGGDDSPVGSAAINLIPSELRGPCSPIVVAFSKGDRKGLGFPAIMRRVREHLIRCPQTRVAIILCDHWHPGMLGDHLGDLRAHHQEHGVQFLFFMAGTPNRVLAPVAVDLDVSP
jgi:hypothetical protein